MNSIISFRRVFIGTMSTGKMISIPMLLSALLVVFYAIEVDAQDQFRDKKMYYELYVGEPREAKFKQVNDRYEVQEDTIFFVNSGFLIDVEYDEITINNERYIIVTYPEFVGGRQSEAAGSIGPVAAVVGTNPVNFPLAGKRALNGKTLLISKAQFDKIEKTSVYSTSWRNRRNYQLTSGQLTIPFKLRTKTGDTEFQMTTDVTIGAYVGVRKRLSKRQDTFITIPATLGLTFINVNDNTTAPTGSSENPTGIVPGWTWSTGVVFEFNKFSAGLVLGRDYASGVANDWIYHDKTWYSFAIGYSFLK
jgi:hypothetical protein